MLLKMIWHKVKWEWYNFTILNVISIKTWKEIVIECAQRGASLLAQLVKNLSAMWETWVQSLGWEDPLEKDMATHSSTLAWRIPWMEEPGRLQSTGSQRVEHDWSDLACTHARMHIQSRRVFARGWGERGKWTDCWMSMEGVSGVTKTFWNWTAAAIA